MVTINRLSMSIALLITGLATDGHAAPKCDFRLDGQPELQWTAFKTTAKAPVKGSFKTIAVRSKNGGSSVPGLLNSIIYNLAAGATTQGEAARDSNISKAFFQKMAGSDHILGSLKAKGDDRKGELTVQLRMNGEAREIKIPYAVNEQGVLTAQGSTDLLKLGLRVPFDSLHVLCGDLHRGEDGVSKTWSEVELLVTAKVDRNCASDAQPGDR